MSAYLNSILLIGPLACGKSAIAEQLSLHSGMKNYSLDRLKWYYRYRNGYDTIKSRNLLKNQGFEALLGYAQHYFYPNDLEDILKQFQGIIDLGATDTHWRDLKKMHQVQQLLKPFPNVFLILPYEDEKLSEEVLNNRIRNRYLHDPIKSSVINTYLKMNLEFLRSQHNQTVAKHVIYTGDRPFHQVAEEIMIKSVRQANLLRQTAL